MSTATAADHKAEIIAAHARVVAAVGSPDSPLSDAAKVVSAHASLAGTSLATVCVARRPILRAAFSVSEAQLSASGHQILIFLPVVSRFLITQFPFTQARAHVSEFFRFLAIKAVVTDAVPSATVDAVFAAQLTDTRRRAPSGALQALAPRLASPRLALRIAPRLRLS